MIHSLIVHLVPKMPCLKMSGESASVAVVSLSVYCLYCPQNRYHWWTRTCPFFFIFPETSLSPPELCRCIKKPPSFRSAVVKTLLPLRAFGFLVCVMSAVNRPVVLRQLSASLLPPGVRSAPRGTNARARSNLFVVEVVYRVSLGGGGGPAGALPPPPLASGGGEGGGREYSTAALETAWRIFTERLSLFLATSLSLFPAFAPFVSCWGGWGVSLKKHPVLQYEGHPKIWFNL